MGDSTQKPSADSSDSYFAGDYQEIIYTGLIGWFSRLTHELMDRPFRNTKTPVVLEVGAGVGQHARYSRTDFDTYYSTDISDDALAACTTKDPRVIVMKADAQHLSTFADESVDRVVATCLLAHLADPERPSRNGGASLSQVGLFPFTSPPNQGCFCAFFVTSPSFPNLGALATIICPSSTEITATITRACD